MKRFLQIFKIVVPSLLILGLIYHLRYGMDLLAGLLIYFPILHIVMGIACKGFRAELIPAVLLANLAFLLPINLFFNMTSCIGYAVAYDLLSLVSFWIKSRICKKFH